MSFTEDDIRAILEMVTPLLEQTLATAVKAAVDATPVSVWRPGTVRSVDDPSRVVSVLVDGNEIELQAGVLGGVMPAEAERVMVMFQPPSAVWALPLLSSDVGPTGEVGPTGATGPTGGTGGTGLSMTHRGSFRTSVDQGATASEYAQSTSFTPAANSLLVMVAGGYSRGVAGNPLTDPNPAAISGMSLFVDYDWTGGTPLAGWTIVDGDDTPNGEKSASRPSNVTIENDAACRGGVFMRCAMRQESYAGQSYTGVQMENFGTLYGNGSPFFVEVRLRWTGFDGFWCGPWMVQYPTYPQSEIDIMETINLAQPWTTLHPYGWNTGDHIGAGYAATNDGQWHTYGLRVDNSGVYRYFDNVQISSYTNTTHAIEFVGAIMGLKFQAFVGGSWPDSDAGHTTPQAGTAFPNYFDCDWERIYR